MAIKEPSSAPSNVRVGLWAKRYMSSPAADYAYVGTLLTREMFDAVVGSRCPPLQRLSSAAQKMTREQKTLNKISSLMQGPYGMQFTEHRMADAKAMCERNWGHFQDTPGELLFAMANVFYKCLQGHVFEHHEATLFFCLPRSCRRMAG